LLAVAAAAKYTELIAGGIVAISAFFKSQPPPPSPKVIEIVLNPGFVQGAKVAGIYTEWADGFQSTKMYSSADLNMIIINYAGRY